LGVLLYLGRNAGRRHYYADLFQKEEVVLNKVII
jgi:hypothetical protein